eukprot:s1371_g6.t1
MNESIDVQFPGYGPRPRPMAGRFGTHLQHSTGERLCHWSGKQALDLPAKGQWCEDVHHRGPCSEDEVRCRDWKDCQRRSP